MMASLLRQMCDMGRASVAMLVIFCTVCEGCMFPISSSSESRELDRFRDDTILGTLSTAQDSGFGNFTLDSDMYSPWVPIQAKISVGKHPPDELQFHLINIETGKCVKIVKSGDVQSEAIRTIVSETGTVLEVDDNMLSPLAGYADRPCVPRGVYYIQCIANAPDRQIEICRSANFAVAIR
jgi:hypothetical protein